MKCPRCCPRISPQVRTNRVGKILALLSACILATGALAQDSAPESAPVSVSSNPSPATNSRSGGSGRSAFTNLNPANLKAMLQPEATPAENTNIAAEPGNFPLAGVTSVTTPALDETKAFQERLELARSQRAVQQTELAANTLISLLQTNGPVELKRPALFELALVAQDANELAKAAQIFAQYLQVYPDDPSVPEVLLRQGMIYRQMGVNTLAISKFYAVMSTALKLKLDKMDYYKKLVLQAQIEIADTYYLEGKYAEASDYFTRLLKSPPPDLDQAQIEYKLVRSLSGLSNHSETIARGQVFLETHPNSADVPEVRFILASTMKKLGRNQDALRQVLLLLQSQHENVQKNPETWSYWQRRAGTEIASQLFKEGDYLDALQINLSLADLDKSAAWQLPVWYQTALLYEQLQQWPKAADTYQAILDRQKELTDAGATPSLLSLLEMAKWRKDYIAWLEKANTTDQLFQVNATNRPPAGPVVSR